MDKLLECKELCVFYEGKQILNNVSFEIYDGDFVCIVGENGAGKSTLTNAILGLLPVASGTITMHGITKSDIGYLPQKFKVAANFPASVKEVVMSGFVGKTFFSPFYSKKQKCKADDAMRLLGLDSIKNRSYLELSGGQQQRVLLARAVCAAEKLVLLDEPVTGLDIAATNNFYNLICHLNTHHDMTILMVSHDIETAVKYCGKVLHLGDGVQYFGSAKEYTNTGTYKRFVQKEEK